MAQNIEIANAQYNDVPSIEVPLQGGGMASFVDTTDADAVASEIDSGKTAYVNGVKLTGTRSGGGGSNEVAIPDPLFSTLIFNQTSSWDNTSTMDYTYTATKPCFIAGMIAATGTNATEEDGVAVLINNVYVGNAVYNYNNASVTTPVLYALAKDDVFAVRRQNGSLKMYLKVCDIKTTTSPTSLPIAVPDMTNKVATVVEQVDSWSNNMNVSYTATQDCIVVGMLGSYGSGTPTNTTGVQVSINGEYLYSAYYSTNNASIIVPVNIPLAQNDVLNVKRLTGYAKAYLHAYALR